MNPIYIYIYRYGGPQSTAHALHSGFRISCLPLLRSKTWNVSLWFLWGSLRIIYKGLILEIHIDRRKYPHGGYFQNPRSRNLGPPYKRTRVFFARKLIVNARLFQFFKTILRILQNTKPPVIMNRILQDSGNARILQNFPPGASPGGFLSLPGGEPRCVLGSAWT